MEAVILTGGRGTRMGALTENRLKSLQYPNGVTLSKNVAGGVNVKCLLHFYLFDY